MSDHTLGARQLDAHPAIAAARPAEATSAGHGLDDEIRTVEAARWLDALAGARAKGFTFLDHLACIDEIGRGDELRLVARLVDFRTRVARGLQLHVRVPRDGGRLPTATQLFAGAAWHEREAHDFFGLVFDGGDQAPLLNHTAGLHPLRKEVVLAARAAQPWPGAKEPGEGASAPSRRKMAPPGVPDPTVWGDRDPQAPSPTPDEIAAAVTGGRVRRRR